MLFGLLLVALLPLAASTTALAQTTHVLDLEPPGPREFVRDVADLLDEAGAAHVRNVCDRLLTDTATPIVVVTVESMAQHGGGGLRIETFATLLFDQWQVGQANVNGRDWNTGILLVVSRDDRRARIELGAGFGRREDAECKRIMDEEIVPRFKRGDDSAGIVDGVDALDRMARRFVAHELTPPEPVDHGARSWRHEDSSDHSVLWTIGLIGLAAFTAISLVRRGASGWAWLFWGVVFSVVGTILVSVLTRRNSSSWSGTGGGFSGGSFGGGFSGGGGASGSW